MKNDTDVIVIGGGAAGMMAAGRAAEEGARVLLLERNPRPGAKLRITGKGRCNITNSGDIRQFIENSGPQGNFLYRAFSRFFNQDVMQFLEDRGVPVKTERGGRVFPVSDRAADVVAALERYLQETGVTLRTGTRARRILMDKGSVAGVEMEGGAREQASAVVIATGGAAYPRTGSTGDGYVMAQELGHTVVTVRPALVPLDTKEEFVGRLEGLELKNVRVTAFAGEEIGSGFGEMSFTGTGVSGPVILTMSGDIVDALRDGKETAISIDFKPALDASILDRRLLREIEAAGNGPFSGIMGTLLPRQLVPVFIERSGIAAEKKASQISRSDRERVLRLLKDFRLGVCGARSFDEAIITRGGIALNEIDPRTMGSKKVKGLYFCGEIIDLDARTGGYNLQIAFSTGYLAGESAAHAIIE